MPLGHLNLTDIYLLRWNKTTFVIFVVVLAIWLWTVDRRMKEDGGSGIFGDLFGD